MSTLTEHQQRLDLITRGLAGDPRARRALVEVIAELDLQIAKLQRELRELDQSARRID